jgi:hypothetical protein
MGTNRAPLFAYLFLHVHEADFHHEFLMNEDRKLARTFNSCFRYVDDVLSLDNSRLCDQ